MEKSGAEKAAMKGSYLKFALMTAVSFVIIYAVMFINVLEFNHIYLSLNRFHPALLMVAAMSLLMTGFMGGMYRNKKMNTAILGASVDVFVLTLICRGRRRLPVTGNIREE